MVSGPGATGLVSGGSARHAAALDVPGTLTAKRQARHRDFRADCLRELKKLSAAWPDLHVRPVTGGLLLSPSPPRIAPSQLRLVE